MGKIPGISHQEAIRAFRKAGFEITRQSGHVVMFDGRRTNVIPRSGQINAITMFEIVKDTGLTAEQFANFFSCSGGIMRHEFTAVIERDGDWFVGWTPELPGANGQGRSVDECRENLAEAITLLLEDRREDGLRGVPPEAIQDVVRVA